MNSTPSGNGKDCDTDALNSLLRGELSAVETYEQAMKKFEGGDQGVLSNLRRIRDQHADAVGELRSRVVQFGGQPSASSGPWGTFAAAVTGTAKAFGPGTALSALREGEEHGISEYEEALRNEKIDRGCKEVIQTRLMANCQRHIAELNRMIDSAK